MSNKVLIIAVLLSLVISLATAVEKVDLREAQTAFAQMRSVQGLSHQAMLQQALGLGQQTTLELIRSTKDRSGISHSRYRLMYRGVPVWGEHVTVSQNNQRMMRMHGNAILGLEAEIENVKPSFDAKTALKAMKQLHLSRSIIVDTNAVKYLNETSELVVYVDDNNRATLSYAVSFFSDLEQGGQPSRPVFILDAKSKKVLLQFEALTTDGRGATGPGGNGKTGQYAYGTKFSTLDVKRQGNTSIMESTNVKTLDMGHSSWGGSVHTFEGLENTHKSVNGAFCPLNDAHYFGNVVFNMYSEWYGTAPLTFQLKMRVHYNRNYENAFWNGSSMTFGDGATRFYPLVSLDVSAHEVSHGFTEQNSSLVYRNQSGGINEAFSDIAGEAAEYFMHKKNDWMIGAEIFKAAGALRYMEDPTRDGRSIGSAKNYRAGMNVHYSSGVFNRAFFLLSNKSGWGVQKAFEVFVRANQNNWTSSSNYKQGAKGVIDAASDLGYNTGDVASVFQAVDVDVSVD